MEVLTTPENIVCRWCQKYQETPFHIVWSCEAFYQSSNKHFGDQEGDPNDEGFVINWGAQQMLKFIKIPRIEEMLTPNLDDVGEA